MSMPPCLAAALDYLKWGWSALALCPPDHVGVGKNHGSYCDSPGKCPVGTWAVWQKRLPTPEELQVSWKEQPNANVGVALGHVSQMVGIDVDGSDGLHLLEKISAGDLPKTLEFSTPGGGIRLLYKVPKGHPLPITKLGGQGAHQELRLLAQGSQTVMPPSKHKSGGTYIWSEGCSPWELGITAAPPWLLERLAKKAQLANATPAHHTNGHAPIPQGSR